VYRGDCRLVLVVEGDIEGGFRWLCLPHELSAFAAAGDARPPTQQLKRHTQKRNAI
jgi:hypothetical protein